RQNGRWRHGRPPRLRTRGRGSRYAGRACRLRVGEPVDRRIREHGIDARLQIEGEQVVRRFAAIGTHARGHHVSAQSKPSRAEPKHPRSDTRMCGMSASISPTGLHGHQVTDADWIAIAARLTVAYRVLKRAVAERVRRL